MRRLCFNASFFFLIWSLLPHYHLITHTHQGGEHGHSHASVDGKFFGQIISAFNDSKDDSKADAKEPSPRESAAKPEPRSQESGSALAPTRDLAHSHYSEDANVSVLPTESARIAPCYLAAYSPAPGYRGPISSPPFSAAARGPPALPAA